MSTVHAKAEVMPMTGAIGVRIEGVDVADDSSVQLVDALRAILDEYLVIHLPGQDDLGPGALRDFAARWGDVVDDVNVPSLDGHAGVRSTADLTEQASTWRRDLTYVPTPPAVTMHVAREVPTSGGDTLWADQYTAYERLSPGLRDALEGLFGVHEATFPTGGGDARFATKSSVHPVVVTHDRTARRALFVDANYTTRLDGWRADESTALLDLLRGAATATRLVCRHRWTAGDLVIWDNRATVHRTVDDLPAGHARTIHRVSVAGGIPRGGPGLTPPVLPQARAPGRRGGV